ncbi:MAG: hypothetical protein KGL39_42540 [Patescibacteria group bacterium]|nr:hypothetical protein [Patescibacteria group bacterium]
MYLGKRETIVNHYLPVNGVRPAHGNRYAVLHFYRCEHCGRETPGQIEQASEPFFCTCSRAASGRQRGNFAESTQWRKEP